MSDTYNANKTPENLRDLFLAHLAEKVPNQKCECCGHEQWAILSERANPNHYSFISHGDGGWPAMGITCRNCGYIRMFTVQPLIDAMQKGEK